MKKPIVSFFSACLLSSAVAFAEKVSSTTNNTMYQKESAAKSSNSNYISQLAMFEQISEAYATKVHITLEKGKTELLNAYKKYTDSADNIIKSINTGQENILISSKRSMQETVANLNKLKGNVSKIISNKKDFLKELSESYAKRVAYYTKKAEKIKLDGVEALSKIMEKSANAKHKMDQAVKYVINGHKIYKKINNIKPKRPLAAKNPKIDNKLVPSSTEQNYNERVFKIRHDGITK